MNKFSFNDNINEWDVSSVTDMNSMFFSANNFNQPLNGWNVSSVTDMSMMFCDASNFNQPLNKWKVSSVTNMYYMFNNAHQFNQNLKSWNVSKVTNMGYMFALAFNFNNGSPKGVSNVFQWDVSSVGDMSSMFQLALSFNGDISGWNVSKVKNMNNMFLNASKFNQNLNCWKVDPSGIVKIEKMFTGTVIGNNKNDPISTLCWQYTMLEKGDCKECSKYICDGNSGDCFNSPYGPFSSLSECESDGCLDRSAFAKLYCNNATAFKSCNKLTNQTNGCNEHKLTDRNNNPIANYSSNNYCVSYNFSKNDKMCIPKCDPAINNCNKESHHDLFDSGCTNDDIINNEHECTYGYNQNETSQNTLCEWGGVIPKCFDSNTYCGE